MISSLKAQLGTNDLFIASPPAATSVTIELQPQEKVGGFRLYANSRRCDQRTRV